MKKLFLLISTISLLMIASCGSPEKDKEKDKTKYYPEIPILNVSVDVDIEWIENSGCFIVKEGQYSHEYYPKSNFHCRVDFYSGIYCLTVNESHTRDKKFHITQTNENSPNYNVEVELRKVRSEKDNESPYFGYYHILNGSRDIISLPEGLEISKNTARKSKHCFYSRKEYER